MSVWIRNEPIRLYGINAPELRGEEREEGLKSHDRLRELNLDEEIYLETVQDPRGKYGRYLAKIWVQIDDEWTNANELMVTEGFAEYKEY